MGQIGVFLFFSERNLWPEFQCDNKVIHDCIDHAMHLHAHPLRRVLLPDPLPNLALLPSLTLILLPRHTFFVSMHICHLLLKESDQNRAELFV